MKMHHFENRISNPLFVGVAFISVKIVYCLF